MWPMTPANVAGSARPFDSKEGVMAEAGFPHHRWQLTPVRVHSNISRSVLLGAAGNT
jgi:hypothetical protein